MIALLTTHSAASARARLRREEAVFIERHKSREWRRNEQRTAPAKRGRLAGKAHFTHARED